MVLIPLSFVLVIEASHETFGNAIMLYIAGASLFATSIYVWNRTWEQIKSEEIKQKAEEAKQKTNEGKILSELETMNKNISGLITEIREDRNERNKGMGDENNKAGHSKRI